MTPSRPMVPIAVLSAAFLFNLGQGVLRPSMPLYLERTFAANYRMVTLIPVVSGTGKWIANLPTGYLLSGFNGDSDGCSCVPVPPLSCQTGSSRRRTYRPARQSERAWTTRGAVVWRQRLGPMGPYARADPDLCSLAGKHVAADASRHPRRVYLGRRGRGGDSSPSFRRL
jgi:hypothetical protein